MIDPEALLIPVSEENPCGEDISYDAKFLELDTLLAGKQETQFSAAEEPDWKALREACLELFGRSKHLRVAVLLAGTLVKLDGPSGLLGGLALIRNLLERYWADLYPKLDPEDDNDPLERINIISALSTPLGTFGDPLRFIERIRKMPLCNSPQMGRFSMAELAGDTAGAGTEEAAGAVSPAQVAAAFRDTPLEELEANMQAVKEAIAEARTIDAFLTQTVGADKAPDMDALINALEEISKNLSPYVGNDMEEAGAAAPAETSSAGGSVGGKGTGAIETRRDVQRALDAICEYYSRHESTSPVPLLLKRARRMVDMDFLAIVNEMAPEAMGQINVIAGSVSSGSGSDFSPSEDEASA